MQKNLKDVLNNHFRTNFSLYIIVILSFTIGIFTGVLTVNALDIKQVEEIQKYLKDFFYIFQGQDINSYEVFKISILKNVKTVFLLWLLGMTIAGIPFILILTGIKGFVIGFSVACFIKAYSFKGIFFSLMCIFPVNIIIIPCLVLLSMSCIRFSLLLYKTITGKAVKKLDLRKSFASYSIVVVLIFMIMSLASVVEAFIIPLFIKLISSAYYV